MALPHAEPQLREHVGVKVMLCRLLVKRSVVEYLMQCAQLLPSVGFCCCCCCHISFPATFHSPVYIRATYAGSSNMLACGFLKAVPTGLGELPYHHLKL